MKQLFIILFILRTHNLNAQEQFAAVNTTPALSNVIFNTTDISEVTPSPPPPRTCVNGYIIGSYVLGFAGGALIGWPLGTALGGGDPEWYLAGIGAVLVGGAIALEIVGKRKCGNYAYSGSPDKFYADRTPPKTLYVASNRQGVGLQLRF